MQPAASSVLSEKEAEERTLRVEGEGGQAALASVLVSVLVSLLTWVGSLPALVPSLRVPRTASLRIQGGSVQAAAVRLFYHCLYYMRW